MRRRCRFGGQDFAEALVARALLMGTPSQAPTWKEAQPMYQLMCFGLHERKCRDPIVRLVKNKGGGLLSVASVRPPLPCPVTPQSETGNPAIGLKGSPAVPRDAWYMRGPTPPRDRQVFFPPALSFLNHIIQTFSYESRDMNGTRGDGIYVADEALQALLENPAQLELARERFSQPPPSYTSRLSHNSTRSQSPDPPSEDRQTRRDRKFKMRMDHGASYPSTQFKDETAEEWARVAKVVQDRTRPTPHLVGRDWTEVAKENVKKRWIEQGIWNDKWKPRDLWT